jgi:hypothetical protein
MEKDIMREEFAKEVQHLTEELAEQIWEAVVDGKVDIERSDEWVRERGSRFLRKALGLALTNRSEQLGVDGECRCGGRIEFRQRRDFQLHTVLAGRDVDVWIQYGQCESCRKGWFPLLSEMRVDREGFTQSLQELSTLAGVMEPYGPASEELLGRFTGVKVSSEKIQSMVRQEGKKASTFLKQMPEEKRSEDSAQEGQKPLYVGIDGGMVFVDGRWQEVKLGCLFKEEDRVVVGKNGDRERGKLISRQVVAIRGNPEELSKFLWPRACAVGADTRKVVGLGVGAPGMWNLAADLFPNRVEILDWYHADEHISKVARVLYEEKTPEAIAWRKEQLDRLKRDHVEEVIEGLTFLRGRYRSGTKREEIEKLVGYLKNNKHRMLYKTYKKSGYNIGSGAVESAVGHVVQQRKKRNGMRWHAPGADLMLALRSIYRCTGAWDKFWASRAA